MQYLKWRLDFIMNFARLLSLLLGIVGAVHASPVTITWTLHDVRTEGGASVTGSFDVMYDPAGPSPYLQVTDVDIDVGPGFVRDGSGNYVDVPDRGYDFTALNIGIAGVGGGFGNQTSLLGLDFCTGVNCNGNVQILGLGFAGPGLFATGGTVDLAYDWRVLGGGYGPPYVGVYSATSNVPKDSAGILTGYVTGAPAGQPATVPEPASVLLLLAPAVAAVFALRQAR